MNGDGALVNSFDDLLEPFVAACERPTQHLIGTEAEKFGVLPKLKGPMSYDGASCGVLGIFKRLLATGKYKPKSEVPGGPILALHAEDGTSITLEPGAQFELSARAAHTLHEVADDIDAHFEEVRPIASACGIEWLGVGFHPIAKRSELPWLPKKRYEIMRAYFPSVGTRGLDMMKRTATVQVNLDFDTEEDAFRKLRTSLKLSPINAAMFANAPIVEGKVTGRASERGTVWLDTDNARAGLTPQFWGEKANFVAYVEWLLDLPMYLIEREGRVIGNTGQTFRQYWKEGLDGYRATKEDWFSHMGTVFPEVRMKQTLEIRSADTQQQPGLIELPALWTGIFYDEQALSEAEAIVADWQPSEVATLRADAAALGLRATFRGQSIRIVAEQLVDAARGGLSRRGIAGRFGSSEVPALDQLVKRVQAGESPGDGLIRGLKPGDELDFDEVVRRCTARAAL